MIKNQAATAHFFVQNTASGLGVSGLTVGGGDFTTIKLSQDGTLGSDIKGSITLVDLGEGFYCFATTAGQMNYNAVLPVIDMDSATYQAYGIVMYTETAVRLTDTIDTGYTLTNTLKAILSKSIGAVAKSGNDYVFKDQDGATLFTITIATNSRTAA